MSFKELEIDIIRWAEARRIIPNSTPQMQLLKCMEELGELVGATLKGNAEGQKDGYGDVLVTLLIAADLAGFDMTDCLRHAYDQIKDRRGFLTEQGVFIKEEAL